MSFARSVCSLVLLAFVLLGCQRVGPVMSVGDPTNTVTPSAFNGSKAGDQREVVGIKLCWCPPGKFIMGSPAGEPERRPGEDQVEVTLTKGFWMAKYETLGNGVPITPNKRIEPMTRRPVTPVPDAGTVDALLVMAHPWRWLSRTRIVDRAMRTTSIFVLAAVMSVLTGCSTPSQSSKLQSERQLSSLPAWKSAPEETKRKMAEFVDIMSAVYRRLGQDIKKEGYRVVFTDVGPESMERDASDVFAVLRERGSGGGVTFSD